MGLVILTISALGKASTDFAPPEVTAFSLDRSEVDVSKAPQSLAVSLGLVDDSDIVSITVRFTHRETGIDYYITEISPGAVIPARCPSNTIDFVYELALPENTKTDIGM